MLEKMIQKLGYKSIIAGNGMEALNIYENQGEKIDGIILDMKMPKMDGKETFIKLKLLDPQIKVLLSTGYGKNELAQEILDLGANDLLLKPYKIDKLRNSLKKLLNI